MIEIFEDINSPSLSGNITILDIDNIMENAPMIGQEYLSLKISTPSLEEEMIDFGENIGIKKNAEFVTKLNIYQNQREIAQMCPKTMEFATILSREPIFFRFSETQKNTAQSQWIISGKYLALL